MGRDAQTRKDGRIRGRAPTRRVGALCPGDAFKQDVAHERNPRSVRTPGPAFQQRVGDVAAHKPERTEARVSPRSRTGTGPIAKHRYYLEIETKLPPTRRAATERCNRPDKLTPIRTEGNRERALPEPTAAHESRVATSLVTGLVTGATNPARCYVPDQIFVFESDADEPSWSSASPSSRAPAG